MDQRFVATVTRSTGSWYECRRDASSGAAGGCEEVFRARLRGKLRLGGSRATNPVVVGDRVECVYSEGDVWIEKVLPRKNYVIRRASNLSRESHIIAANVDQALVVATLAAPVTSQEFIDRFLVTCEAYSIPVTIVLNKTDLEVPTERFVEVYERAGYEVMQMSALTGQGVSELREFLTGKTTLISGNSGVGKSTLIKAIAPDLDVRIGEISSATGKGKHTTTFSQMYELGCGTYVIDTPGIKGFGLIDIEPAELARYFPDFVRVAPDCEYYNCTHTHEPNCAVIQAVEAGIIGEERYESYLKMLEEDGKHRS